ncbi:MULTISPECIES: ABC transporter substrate-binding protein [Brenneria]|uniref:Oligopeptide ABC transporter substrate-binding protein OppA n=1 Tax=Brenneria nigrifluens DSM 30175 = ATCC 13028 TaxID=1121120 RepID=A0A2U1USB0_9GAMM|nr:MULTISPECIES: ABC transporter substrate-binding protein [Brenneria]EHD21139.1 ABC-type transporter, periplasmic subunit [Brenneria sp. EniD312]PWC24558.1 oligopeptide ABC transporter substrate-binding protein OppA [Brenneria nigrifluens DSM 30175 = ATCC 13028]QCR04289.1 oligopeptide ABC transporter substrate-binding protein OppA [Brenneria nigrifluens DSM 30175 = ATCC 13028]
MILALNVGKKARGALLFSLCSALPPAAVDAAAVPAGVQLAEKQELVRGNGSEPASLDAHKVESDVEANIIHDFFEKLIAVRDDGSISGGLAEKWEQQDHQLWTFHLRPDLKWSDGTPLTADDVVFSWRRLVDPQTLSPYQSYIPNMHVRNAADIAAGKKPASELGIRALDRRTVQIELDRPLSYFLAMVAHFAVVTLPQAAIEKYGDKWTQPGNFVGSGPFILEEWVVNERIVAKRNPYYWDNVHTILNKVTYLPIVSNTAEVNRYKTGEVEVTFTLPPHLFKALKTELPDQVKVNPQLSTYYYKFNTQKPPFNDPRVRRALDLALDKTVIAEKVLGMGQVPAYSILPPGMAGYTSQQPEWAAWTQQQRNAEAKKLLSAAGFSAQRPLKFDLLYNTSESHQRVAIAASSMWKQVLGVEARLKNQEWKTMLDTMRTGDFQVVRSSWAADYNEPSTYFDILRTGNSNNQGRFTHAEYDALLDRAVNANSVAARNSDDYHQAEKILQQQVPLLPIYYYVRAQLVKPYVGGFKPDQKADIYSKDIYIIKH